RTVTTNNLYNIKFRHLGSFLTSQSILLHQSSNIFYQHNPLSFKNIQILPPHQPLNSFHPP
ncbi:hypothetical protein COBT_004250, partial [Conglomerata obtusa]